MDSNTKVSKPVDLIENSKNVYLSLPVSSKTEDHSQKPGGQFYDQSMKTDPMPSKNDYGRRWKKIKPPIDIYFFCKIVFTLCSIFVSFHLLRFAFIIRNFKTDGSVNVKTSRINECRYQIEFSVNQWLNNSQQIISRSSVDEDRALQCSECTPVQHDVLQKILESYESIDKSCIMDLQRQRDGKYPKVDDTLDPEFPLANNYLQILNSCLLKPFCSWSRTVLLRDIINHNTTGRSRPSFSIPGVQGVTYLDGKIFVIFLLPHKRSRVSVYDAHTLKELPDIRIPHMKKPAGIAACSYNKVLYIGDAELKCIHRVNLTDNTVKRWKVPKNHKPWGLSVTPNFNLLVTSTMSNANVECESRVLEYTSDGKLIRRIKLDISFKWPWHTLELSTDRFIISHGLEYTFHRVCVINCKGKIMKCFGEGQGRGASRLNTPAALKIDTDREIIFVADQWNDRVVMLDYNMTYLGLVQTHGSLKWPSGLDLDLTSDRLIVAETQMNWVYC